MPKIDRVGFALLLFFAAHISHATTLQEALTQAYESSKGLLIEREEVKKTNEGYNTAFSGWLPAAAYTFGLRKGMTSFPAYPGTFIPSKNESMTNQITVSQNIFNGGANVANTKRAKHVIEARRMNLVMTEQKVLASAVSSYMEVLTAQEKLSLADQQVRTFNELLKSAEAKFALGEATKTDVSRARANLAQANAGQIQAAGELAAQKADYRNIVGMEADQLQVPEINYNDVPQTLPELLDLALTNNPTIKLNDHNVSASKAAINIAKASLLPQVSVSYAYTKSGRNTKIPESYTALSPNYTTANETVALNLSVPIYQSGAEYSKIRSSYNDKSIAVLNKDAAYDAIIDTATGTFNYYNSHKAALEAHKVAVESAQVALDGAKYEYQLGSKTITDVLEAERGAFVARTHLVESRKNLVTTFYNLKSLYGALTAKDLGLPTQIYDVEKDYQRVGHKLFGW